MGSNRCLQFKHAVKGLTLSLLCKILKPPKIMDSSEMLMILSLRETKSTQRTPGLVLDQNQKVVLKET
jgi:hypothetical protein